MDKVTVSAKPLAEILKALIGPDHFIRELQLKYRLYESGLIEGKHPIDQLIEEFNEQINNINPS